MSACRTFLLSALAVLAASFNVARAEMPWMMPRSQPFFDIPWQAQHQACPWPWGVWTCEATAPNPRPPRIGPAPGAPGAPGASACGPDGCPCEDPGAIDFGVHPIAHRKCGWWFTGDFVPLMYDSNAHSGFANIGTTGVNVLNDNSLQTELGAGGRYELGVALTDCLAIEGSYNGHYSYKDEAGVRDTSANALGGIGNLSSPFSNFGVPALIPGLDFNNFVNVSLRNRYSTGDINFRYRVDSHPGPFDFFCLAGVRYLRIDEAFRYHSESGAPAAAINDVFVQTSNELWGPQLGLAGNIMVMDRYWVEVEAKGAVCNDSVSQQTVYTNSTALGGINAFNTAAAEERTAWVGDFSIVGNYQLTPNLSFRCGYQATWVAGVGLGIANFQTNPQVLTLGPGQLNHDRTAVYHGPVIGVTWQQ